MNWKSHTLLAFLLSLAIFYFVFPVRDAAQLLQLFVFSALSALVPDLDNDLSKGRKILDASVIILALGVAAYFYFFNSVPGSISSNSILSGSVLFGSIIIFLAITGAYFVAFKTLKPSHRGITHTIVSCFAFSVLIYLIAGFQFAVAGLVGYASHLLADKEIKVL